MKNSFKQLFRMPTKVLLFFFLTAAATALLVVGSVLFAQSSQRIKEVEGSFTTLGIVEQVPIKTVTKVYPSTICGWGGKGWDEIWGERQSIDVLDFEGAEYLIPPQNRPYYVADAPGLSHATQSEFFTQWHVVQAVALRDGEGEFQTARLRVEKVLATYDDGYDILWGYKSSIMKEGKEILVCQCYPYPDHAAFPIEAGKSYIFSLWDHVCLKHAQEMADEGLDSREYVPWTSPYCEQYDKDGNEIPSHFFSSDTRIGLVEEVTEDFWEPGGRGEAWEYWTHYQEYGDHLFTVAPVDTLQLMPLFQNHKAFLKQGREITAEEFESGAAVCMLPDAVLLGSGLKLGDKVDFSMLSAAYGSAGGGLYAALWYGLSPFNAEGKLYESFWQDEYEVVGTYSVAGLSAALNKGLIGNDMVIIPAKSVRASDENNIASYGRLKPGQATFLLPNGSIDAFETALHEAVPDLQGLVITYNDNGYEEIMGSLRSVWITALLLLAVGLLSALATLLLLLYFFIVKQKKRTAIERSLGMSKRQCRVSLLSGILVLALLSSAVGSAGAALLMSKVDLSGSTNTTSTAEAAESEAPGEDLEPTETFAEFSTKFSLWASESNTVDYSGGDAEAPIALFFVIPLAMFALVFVLSLLLINRNLKIEPIYLLSGKME